ncbi:MAG TPA: hypothetical protein V6C58_13790 [Allocoleopsis sp.]
MNVINVNKINRIRVLRYPKESDPRFLGHIYLEDSKDLIDIESTTMLILNNGELKRLYDLLVDAYSQASNQ